jgi:hypothetical protein
MKFTVRPLTKKRGSDLVELFNRPGGSIVRGCWCMYYRRSGASAASVKRTEKALKYLVMNTVLESRLGGCGCQLLTG